ncbi:MAG TPA: CRISPR system precrRNA processing endoribonuclease RAMP protein Cas6 [Clostridia bacterium]|nr:CRISPR system precrRNA processing endoribonuclease RAMP protein Cas6 [Clostridia bacterium]
MLEHFKIACFRMEIVAGKDGLILPRYKGSTLRGCFGAAFRRIACVQRNSTCRDCIVRFQCPYAYIFETAPPENSQALRKYENIPRPFVLEPPLETKTEYQPGEKLSFGLVLVGRAIDYLPYFILAFQELGEIGIGKGRRPFQLDTVTAINPIKKVEQEIYRASTGKVYNHDLAIYGSAILQEAMRIQPDRLTLNFETMTRIKHEDSIVRHIEFHMLIRALLRRLSSMLYFHHGLERKEDFPALIQKAETVTITRDTTRWVDWERYSNRQEARMSLGGVVGQVSYEGDLSDFLPILIIGELIHVGKAATFGMGKYTVSAT